MDELLCYFLVIQPTQQPKGRHSSSGLITAVEEQVYLDWLKRKHVFEQMFWLHAKSGGRLQALKYVFWDMLFFDFFRQQKLLGR